MVSVAGVQGVTAYASNYSDTKFEFSFEYGNTCETGVRAKEDTSSVYIHCTEYEGNDCGFDAYAYGCDNYNGMEASVLVAEILYIMALSLK